MNLSLPSLHGGSLSSDSNTRLSTVQVDMGEENENDVAGEENEEELFTVDNPSLDLEVKIILQLNISGILNFNFWIN